MCKMLLHHFQKCCYVRAGIQGLAQWLSWPSFESRLALELWPYFTKKMERLLTCIVSEKGDDAWRSHWRVVWSCFYWNRSCKEAAETFCVSGRTVQWIMRHFKNRRSRNIEQSLWRAIGGWRDLFTGYCFWQSRNIFGWNYGHMRDWQEKLCTLLHFAGKLRGWG